MPLDVIVNPDSGPGSAQDLNNVSVVNSLRTAGGKALGYVYSSYAARDRNAINSDLTNYFNFYPLDGIFVDEMQKDGDTNHYNCCAAIYAFSQTKGTNVVVMGNPGTTTQEGYFAGADALMTFESGTGYSNYVADTWVTNHLAWAFAHIIYALTNAATRTNYIDRAASRNAGWVFVTDDTIVANPGQTK